MPQYAQLGLKFTYPADWAIAEEESEDWPRSVSFQVGGGYWMVYLYPPQSDRLPLLQEALQTFLSEYKDAETNEVEELISDCLVDGYDVSFFCLDFLVEARIRALEAPSGTLLWMCQAEADDFEERADSFKKVAESMLAGFVQK